MSTKADSPKTAKRTSYHHNSLPEAVIEKAVEYIVERDGPTFSMRELATALGVTHAAVYRHFADKDALLDALARKGFEELASRQKKFQSEAEDTPMEQLYALLFAYLNFASEFPGYYVVMFRARAISETAFFAREIYNTEALGTLLSAIKACQESGDFIEGDVYRMASYTALAPHGLVSHYVQGLFPRILTLASVEAESVRWLADLIFQPLLKKPKSPEEMAKLFM